MDKPQILLNIAGAAVHYDALVKALPLIGLRNKNVKFNVYEGPNLCQWNGGRINRDITLTDEMIKHYNKFGISVSLTFTNHTINLDDPIGNALLESLDRAGKEHNIVNKIICVNDDLRQYVRDRYTFEIIYSITGHPSDVKITDELLARYKDLETKYDFIVPKFEVVFEPEFYSIVDTSKYELLINDTCIYGCKYYYEHFYKIAEQNAASSNPWSELGHDHCRAVEECWLPKFNPDVGSEANRKKYGELLGMDYTPAMIEKAINLGYRAFKISGRENPTTLIIKEIERFIRDTHGKK